jgi:hypothetical protein
MGDGCKNILVIRYAVMFHVCFADNTDGYFASPGLIAYEQLLNASRLRLAVYQTITEGNNAILK